MVTYTIDDAPTRNALSLALLADIDRVLATLADDPSVRLIVFTGARTVFSSGADRAELGDPATVERTTALLGSILTRIHESRVPIVARVNGAAFGAGLAIAAAADISIATTDAVFGLPEVRFGLVAGPAAAACLGRIGKAAGLDLLLTGRRFGAAEAARMHLVTGVVDRAALDAAVEGKVADVLLGDADAIAATRRLVHELSGPPLPELLAIARRAAESESQRYDGFVSRGLARGGVPDVDWRDVPARPRRARPGSELKPELRADLPQLGRSVVTIGTFDGVHRGHTEIIARTVASARRLGLASVLLTFDPHPVELTRPGAHPAVLTTIARRAELAAELGIDHFRVVPFDPGIAQLGPADFVRQVLVERLHAAEVVVGSNFRFGHRASGSVAGLAELANRFGFTTTTVDLVGVDDALSGSRVISSTFLRSCVEAGDVALAGAALGRPHRVDGVVEHGDHRGRTLGFPTANLSFDRFAAVPADGVYAGRAVFLDEWGQTDESVPLGVAAISVGTNPTFDVRQRRVEAHVLDWNQDLYGRRIGLEFHRLLRGMVRFAGVDELVAQMERDVEQTRAG
ncbi:bifunctional riboflavin kinase/FAD synthetase [Amycolatopsis sp. FDAARGOS 1241]|uniref:bifunctional riboflavin kinase/FAD synthetase n=1 Tax=Amycolatopsis sp. FDAARGOS 1241 TaxID=2778070 RepID=UPI001951E473|nr:bifunctional riboflavin kinase/FAD synthetase [Amycolatopsis sp. FDAARGOS 1241]